MKRGADLWLGCKFRAVDSWSLVFEFLSSLTVAKDSLFFYFTSLCFAAANISFLAVLQFSPSEVFDFKMCFLVSMGLGWISSWMLPLVYVTLLLILPYVVRRIPTLLSFLLCWWCYTLFLYCIMLLFCKFRCFVNAVLLEDVVLEWCNVVIDGFVRGAFCMNCACRYWVVVLFWFFNKILFCLSKKMRTILRKRLPILLVI